MVLQLSHEIQSLSLQQNVRGSPSQHNQGVLLRLYQRPFPGLQNFALSKGLHAYLVSLAELFSAGVSAADSVSGTGSISGTGSGSGCVCVAVRQSELSDMGVRLPTVYAKCPAATRQAHPNLPAEPRL